METLKEFIRSFITFILMMILGILILGVTTFCIKVFFFTPYETTTEPTVTEQQGTTNDTDNNTFLEQYGDMDVKEFDKLLEDYKENR